MAVHVVATEPHRFADLRGPTAGTLVGSDDPRRVARLLQHRVGQLLAAAVVVHQPGYVDHAVVHLPALGVPRDLADEPGEDLVGPADPGGSHVDPRPGTQVVAGTAKRPSPSPRKAWW